MAVETSLIDLHKNELLNILEQLSLNDTLMTLVLDTRSMKLLDNYFTLTELLVYNIIKLEKIENPGRTKKPDEEAVYLLTPSEVSVNMLINDFEPKKANSTIVAYQAAHVIFTTTLPQYLYERLRSHKTWSYTKSFYQINMEYEPISRDVFLTQLYKHDYVRLYSTDLKGSFLEDELRLIAKKMANLLFSIGVQDNEQVVIRHYNDTMIWHNMCYELASLLSAEITSGLRLKNNNKDTKVSTGCNAKVNLIILDRSVDLLTPLLHDVTYETMAMEFIHPLSSLTNKKKVYRYSMSDNDKYIYTPAEDKDDVEVEISETTDFLWQELKYLHITEAQSVLKQKLQEFSEKYSGITKLLKGQNDESNSIIDDDNTDGRGKKNNDTTFKTTANAISDMKDTMLKINDYNRAKNLFSIHVKLMERCMHEIEKNKLKDVLSIEEAVVTGEAYSSTKRTNEIKAQLEAIGISDMLKTRLYLLGLEIRFLLLKNKENKGVKVEVEDDPLLVSPLTALFANEQILWKSLVYISGMTRLYSIREINVSFAREKLINLALKAASTNNSAEFGMGLHAYSGNDDRVQSSILNWINLVDITHTVNWFNCAEENQEKVYHKSIVRLVLETVSVGLLPYNLFPEYFTIKKVFKNNEILNTAKTNGARNYNRNRDNKINHNNESGGSVTHSGTYNSSAINSNSNINNAKNINSAPNVNGDGDTTGNSFSLLKNTEDFFNNINKRSPGLKKASREPLMLNKKFKIITQKTPTWQVNRSSVINTLNYDTSISDNGGFKDIPKVQDRVSSEKMYDNHTPKTTHRTFIPSTLRNTSVFKKKRFAKDEKFEESSDYKTKVDSSTTSAKNSENCDNNVNEDAPIKQSTTNPFEHSRNKSEKNNDKKYTSHNRRVSIASSPGVSLPPVLNANRPMIIVFVLGGITYSELKEAHNIAVAKNYRILLGSNEILTASKFFNHLSDLSESPANPNEKLSANLIPSYKAMGYGGFKDKSTAAGTSGGSSGGGLYGGAAKKTQNNNSPVSKINSKMGELLSSTSNSVSTAADDPLLSFISLHP